jgi:rod shape-determining protein MreC
MTGGDRVFPKGLPVGTVSAVFPDRERDPFLAIRVKPAVNLGRLEEVLVVTRILEQQIVTDNTNGPVRAADVLAQRLPSAKKKTAEEVAKQNAAAAAAPGGETPAMPAGDPSLSPPATQAATDPKIAKPSATVGNGAATPGNGAANPNKAANASGAATDNKKKNEASVATDKPKKDIPH